MAKVRDFKFCTYTGSPRNVFKFWEISDNNLKTVQDRRIVSIKVE